MPGVTYFYKVRALTAGGELISEYSLPKGKTCIKAVGIPVLSAELADGGKVRLSWNAAEDANRYKLFRSEQPDDGFALIATTTKTSYTDALPGAVT
ncbi:MAG: hypothetical protein J6036_06210, partial [Clostridia bacterium]|nr:hypothetical protein [Clostridia bacterium]